MSVNWRTTESGTFVIIDRQGLVGKFFGGFMLFISGCFLYWLGSAIVEYIRFGTLLSMVAIKCTKNGLLKMGHQGDGLGGLIKDPPSSSSRVNSR
jgi:hypothetical protein